MGNSAYSKFYNDALKTVSCPVSLDMFRTYAKKMKIPDDLIDVDATFERYTDDHVKKNISIEKANELLMKTDVFLSHAWGKNQETHKRVIAFNKMLEALGVKTWFDENYLNAGDDVSGEICKGLEHTSCFIVFITRDYDNKIHANRAGDYCVYEFRAAKSYKKKLMPIVMEQGMTNTDSWQMGKLRAEFGGTLYADCSENDEFDVNRVIRSLNKLGIQFWWERRVHDTPRARGEEPHEEMVNRITQQKLVTQQLLKEMSTVSNPLSEEKKVQDSSSSAQLDVENLLHEIKGTDNSKSEKSIFKYEKASQKVTVEPDVSSDDSEGPFRATTKTRAVINSTINAKVSIRGSNSNATQVLNKTEKDKAPLIKALIGVPATNITGAGSLISAGVPSSINNKHAMAFSSVAASITSTPAAKELLSSDRKRKSFPPSDPLHPHPSEVEMSFGSPYEKAKAQYISNGYKMNGIDTSKLSGFEKAKLSMLKEGIDHDANTKSNKKMKI